MSPINVFIKNDNNNKTFRQENIKDLKFLISFGLDSDLFAGIDQFWFLYVGDYWNQKILH